jgi:hypothetical protein
VWRDPDDAPEITDDMLDRADIKSTKPNSRWNAMFVSYETKSGDAPTFDPIGPPPVQRQDGATERAEPGKDSQE